MKYFINFIGNYGRDQSKKRSFYEKVVCDSYEPDISGMVAMKNCISIETCHYNSYNFGVGYIGELPRIHRESFAYSFSYQKKEAVIIVNREDISEMKAIEDDKVILPEFTEENYQAEKERLEKQSKEHAEKELDNWLDEEKKKHLATNEEKETVATKKKNNIFTDFVEWIKYELERMAK